MKALVTILTLAALGSAAYAVSIDFTVLTAVSIGDVQTRDTDDFHSTEVEFSGPGLRPLMALLPKVTDENGQVPNLRMLEITNAGQPGVPSNDTTSIYLECESATSGPKCRISIYRGATPG